VSGRRSRPAHAPSRGVGLWDALRAALTPGTGLGSLETLALIAVWRHANFEGETWLSFETLARECKACRRQAIRAVKALEAAGAVEVDRGGGRGRVNILRVVPAWVTSQLARAGADQIGTDASDPNPLIGDTESPITPEKGDTTPPFPGKGDTQVGKGDTQVGKGDIHARNGDSQSPSSALVVPLVEPCVEGGREDARDPTHGSSPAATPEEIAATIAAATARLGGKWARRGRDIAARYLEHPSPAATEMELVRLAREAGVARTNLGVSFEAIYAAHGAGL
jgi:Helix-turn-helix domain